MKETESKLQCGGPVTDGALKGMPQPQTVVNQRHDSNATESLANCPAVAQVYTQGKVNNQPDHTVPVSEKPEINTDIRIQVQKAGS